MRVLVAVDGGGYSGEIMDATAHLTGPGDEVYLLSVIRPSEVRDTYSSAGGVVQTSAGQIATATGQTLPSTELRRAPVESGAQAVQRALDERRSHVQALTHRVPGGPRWDVIVEVDDDPAEAILNAARRLKVHGIAMGTRGRRGMMHALLGSVAETIIRKAPVPVLVVRDGLEVPAPAANGAS